MRATTMSGREFEQSANEARAASANGPVFIAEHGQVSHVLLHVDEYRRLTGGLTPLLDSVAMKNADVDDGFHAARVELRLRVADLGD